jgi:molecular chaperone DnaK (HSP70)
MIIVGIDLGTSNSSICYFNNGHIKIIKDNNTHNISSIITFTKYGKVFGNKAKSISDNNIFISNIKRLIGYNYIDLDPEYYSQFPFTIINNNQHIGIVIDKQIYSPSELMIYFLNYLKLLIENEIKNEKYKVIVTVPAYFNIQQKEAINNCIITVGFDLVKLLSEPTSASIAYDNFINFKDEDNVLVFDLGGGTLDLSIINISKLDDDPEKSHYVKATYGDNKFGGSDLTFKLIEYIKLKYPEYNLVNNNLFDYIDSLKIVLNKYQTQETIKINDHEITITYAEFKNIVNEWTKNIDNTVTTILDLSGINKNDINHIVLVGGCSKIVQVKETLETYFNKKINNYCIDTENIEMEDIAVSYGSALHGYILYSTKNLILVDICPFTIGIEASEGTMIPIIDCNSQIPIKRTKQFTTEDDDMTEVKIKIFQGESKFVKNNIYLGEFTLSGIPKAKKNVPVINVMVEINNSGLLRVTARDRKSITTNEIIVDAKDYKLDDHNIDDIKNKMLINRESEDILFNLLEKYNTFIFNYDKIVFNLIINPVSKFDVEYIDNIKQDIVDKIKIIYKTIKSESFDSIISFDKFFNLTAVLFNTDIDKEIEHSNTITCTNVLTYLKKLFDEFNKHLSEKYHGLLLNYNNDNMDDKTYDKSSLTCLIDDDGDPNVKEKLIDDKLVNVLTTSVTELSNELYDSTVDRYNIKLYEFGELIKGLIDNLEMIPLNSTGKDLLISYIEEIQLNINENLLNNSTDIIDKINLLEGSINSVNEYCQELSKEYHFISNSI